MANRVLRDWTDSEKINSLSAHAERFFVRLIMKADDFGCFHADPRLIKAHLFPLLLDSIREADLSRWMEEIQKAGLIVVYQNSNKKYVQIVGFKQRLRQMKSKFPKLDGQLTDSGRPETRNESETKLESETETKSGLIFYKADNLILECLDSEWMQTTAMHYKVGLEWLKTRFTDFCKEQELKEALGRNLRELKNHFINTLKTEIKNKFTNKTDFVDHVSKVEDSASKVFKEWDNETKKTA